MKRCLQGIKAILPKETAVQMLVKWYNAYNAPGGPSYHSEWNLFVTCLMNMMGYNTERLCWTRNVSKFLLYFQFSGLFHSVFIMRDIYYKNKL